MKSFTIASIVALASVASAQLDNIPSCALSCLVGPLTSDGCSALTDFKCHCEKGASLLATVQPCVQSSCSDADEAAVIAAVQKTCADVGVPIEIPGAGAASSAGAAVSSAIASASSAVASAASSAAAEVSSKASAVSSMAHSMTGTGMPSASMTKSTPTGTPPPFTGAAAQATQAAGLLGAAALAMLAL